MSDSNKQVVHVTEYKRHWSKTARHWWPLFIFLGILSFAIFLYSNGGKYRVIIGTAERIVERIAPLEAARVSSIQVKVGDRVKAGDVIVQLDTAIIDAEGAVLRERLEQSRVEAQLEQLTLERQFTSALQEAEQTLREAELEYKVSQVEHSVLLDEIKRLEPLFEQQLIEAELIVVKKAREEVLREMLELMPINIHELSKDAESSRLQKDSAIERLQAMNSVASKNSGNEETINLMKIRRDGYTLRAQQDGVVASVDSQPGDVVKPGEEIVSILIDGPTRIVGFLTENNLSAIELGTPAKIYPSVSMNDTGVVPAHVVQVSPAVYSLPQRVSPIRGQIVRGRRVTFELDKEVLLIPGETVSIEIESSLFEQTPSLN